MTQHLAWDGGQAGLRREPDDGGFVAGLPGGDELAAFEDLNGLLASHAPIVAVAQA